LFITNLLDGLAVPLYGDGGNVREWVHVDDHCPGIQLIAEKRPAGPRLSHRRRCRSDQRGADKRHPGSLRGRTGDGQARR
jgi:nucleoside-diphosphate-sugar epimerase